MISIFLTKEKTIAGIAMTAVIVLCIIYFFIYFRIEVPESKYEIKNTDRQRRIFIESYGYTLKADKPKTENFKVPYDFNNTLMEFEKLQNEMGLSLEKFKGETLKKYSYLLSGTKKPVYAEIYIYGKYVVAGCIVNPDLKDGYIKAF